MVTSGVTRLVLGLTGSGPVSVSGLVSPVLFTLPGVAPPNGTQASCTFFNNATQALDTRGCASLPSPAPANHVVFFKPGFQAPNDTALAWAWDVNGSLAANCSQTVLDCNATPTRKIYLDPFNPFTLGAVSCPNGSTQVLRVFYGTACGLWNPANAYNCSWNAVKQTFEGGGCLAASKTRCMCRCVCPRPRVLPTRQASPAPGSAPLPDRHRSRIGTAPGSAPLPDRHRAPSRSSPARSCRRKPYAAGTAAVTASGSLRCFPWRRHHSSVVGAKAACESARVASGACRHLTDFVAVRKPTIAVCSVSQLTSLSADDVFNKLRFLLFVICALFGGASAAPPPLSPPVASGAIPGLSGAC